MLIGSLDDLVVPNRPTGLNYCRYSGLRRFIDTVPERERMHRKPRQLPLAVGCAFWILSFTESTRLICPAPTPTVRPPSASTMALDFTCLATRQANCRSDCSFSVGLRLGHDPRFRAEKSIVRILKQNAAGNPS